MLLWKNIKEDIPKVAKDVILYSKVFGVGTGFYAPHIFENGQHHPKEWLYRGQGSAFRVDDITHWMPLPEPPVPICNVCNEPIDDEEEFCECDACGLPFHWGDCGGRGSVVGIETAGCNNCAKMD